MLGSLADRAVQKNDCFLGFFFLISDLMGYILKRLITGLYNCVSVNGLEYCEPMYVKA